jgi:hypothetical protein
MRFVQAIAINTTNVTANMAGGRGIVVHAAQKGVEVGINAR